MIYTEAAELILGILPAMTTLKSHERTIEVYYRAKRHGVFNVVMKFHENGSA